LILSYGSLAQPNNNTLVSQCMQLPISNNNLCFVVTSNDCLQLTGTVMYNTANILGPQHILLDRFLGVFQRQLRDPSYADGTKKVTTCLPLPIPQFQCNACSTMSDLKINGDNLHYCGTLTVNCTVLGVSYDRTLQLPNPCVDLRNCQTYGCQNNCSNAGRCTTYGLCRCSPGHFGFDCSTVIANNCISSSTIPKSCWKFNFPDCNTVNYQVNTPAGEITQKVILNKPGSSLKLVPCQKFSNPSFNNMNCEMCVDANQLSVEGDNLIGCPSVVVKCNGVEVNNTQLDCLPLAQSPALVCPQTTPKETNSTSILGTQNTAKTVLIAMSAILGIVLLGTGGYLVTTKVIGFDGRLPFQRVDSYLTEDVEPLNGEKTTVQEKSDELHVEDLEEDSV